MSRNLATLEDLIGHKFKDPKLLERAVTHRSWAYENLPGATDEQVREIENESLEFLGDSILGLVVAEQLYRRNPGLTEGDLTLMKHHLVSGPALAGVSESIGLGEYLRLGGSEIKTGRSKQSLLTNAFEAVIAAVFLDSSYIVTRAVIVRLMEESLKNVRPETSVDFKSRLQAELQARKQRTAEYHLIRSEGPPHSRRFFVEVSWADGRAKGEGNSIKAAEMKAAEQALAELKPITAPAPKRGNSK
jgi:ribonuclease-3